MKNFRLLSLALLTLIILSCNKDDEDNENDVIWEITIKEVCDLPQFKYSVCVTEKTKTDIDKQLENQSANGSTCQDEYIEFFDIYGEEFHSYWISSVKESTCNGSYY